MKTHFSNILIVRLVFLVISIFHFIQLEGQSFTALSSTFTGLSNSAAAWADYDNDKDLDLLMSGENENGTMKLLLYNNENGLFEEVSTDFTGIKNGSVTWGDYDNDGDLDILATGNNEEERTFLYRNEGSGFSDVIIGFDYFGAYSHATWADYDNDGDLDIFITGGWNSKLYRNDGAEIFSDTQNQFQALNSSRACMADCDKDGDIDILLTGDTGAGMKLFLYLNNETAFEEIELENMGLSAGSVEWGDYDNDSDLDILIMGFNDMVEPAANIYRNDGNHVFTNIYAGLPPVAMGNASWADADNDGDLDVALTGRLAGCGATVSAVYQNQGNDIFNDINAFLTNAERSTVSWGDFDNDTDLDLLLMGLDNMGNNFSKIYRNDFSLPNILPEIPENLSVSFNGNEVILSWDKSYDSQTPQNCLTYNIRIGSFPGESDILSPMSHVDDGYRKIIDFGNTQNVNAYKFKNPEPGVTYFWSVQALDNTFSASAFADEASFSLPLTFIGTGNLYGMNPEIYPNPATDYFIIKLYGEELQSFKLKVVTSLGKVIINKIISSEETVDISILPAGLYFVQTEGSDLNAEFKLIKK
jgi:hypothetical protein